MGRPQLGNVTAVIAKLDPPRSVASAEPSLELDARWRLRRWFERLELTATMMVLAVGAVALAAFDMPRLNKKIATLNTTIATVNTENTGLKTENARLKKEVEGLNHQGPDLTIASSTEMIIVNGCLQIPANGRLRLLREDPGRYQNVGLRKNSGPATPIP